MDASHMCGCGLLCLFHVSKKVCMCCVWTQIGLHYSLILILSDSSISMYLPISEERLFPEWNKRPAFKFFCGKLKKSSSLVWPTYCTKSPQKFELTPLLYMREIWLIWLILGNMFSEEWQIMLASHKVMKCWLDISILQGLGPASSYFHMYIMYSVVEWSANWAMYHRKWPLQLPCKKKDCLQGFEYPFFGTLS